MGINTLALKWPGLQSQMNTDPLNQNACKQKITALLAFLNLTMQHDNFLNIQLNN